VDRPPLPRAFRMHLTDLLAPDRVAIRTSTRTPEIPSASAGDPTGHVPHTLDKKEALALLASLLARGNERVRPDDIERVLVEREQLQSTGIGDGVAIPHGALPELDAQVASLLIAPEGLDFDAIDSQKVTLLFAVMGPKRATGEHLKTLARVSRLLRNKAFRDQLVRAPSPEVAYSLIAKEEADQK
jgi:PTS system nitrogen regulatory IIA component